jgi:hypothetical protein
MQGHGHCPICTAADVRVAVTTYEGHPLDAERRTKTYFYGRCGHEWDERRAYAQRRWQLLAGS